MSQPPTIPSGMRDFSPAEVARRNYIFSTIKNAFRCYGFAPIETPAMENLSTLLGKYGDEGDKLLFKVLNSGDAFAKIAADELQNPALPLKVCNKGLRYDLTVPLARYVVQHQSEIVLPMRRYQLQPVWRADRPQRGRYREFYQCDADIVGSPSLLSEAELLLMTDTIFAALGINITIKLNSRKILFGIAETLGAADKFAELSIVLDKAEKISTDQLNAELATLGIDGAVISTLTDTMNTLPNQEKLNTLQQILNNSTIGMKGVEEIATILNYIETQPTTCCVNYDHTLARGLNYYTGAIFEVKANDISIGSIAGGGRYDNLTAVFGLKDLTGVGISFGADRIYDTMLALSLFPDNISQTTQIIFLNMGAAEAARSLTIAQILRRNNISAELYPDPRKLNKQMDYANRRSIPFVAIIGENELSDDTITIKNMLTGTQCRIPCNTNNVNDLLHLLQPTT